MNIETNARRNNTSPAGKFYLKPELIFFISTVLLSGIVYRLTLCPTVEFIDSGELALACKNLGIAHPTGYPIYTLLGRLAAFLYPGELIIGLNTMSLVFTALATGFLFLSISNFITIIGIKNRWRNFTAFSVALFGSVTPVWWSQGTTNEVYSLNLLLILISLFALLKYLEADSPRWLFLSFYALGMSLANHLSAVYILPAYIFLVLYRRRKKRMKTRILYLCAAALLFPVSLYLFLPIRASFSPFLNWGGVDDLYFLYKHISGWQYRIWMFTDFSLSSFIDKIISSVSLLYAQFSWYGFLLCAAGIIITALRKTYLAVFGLLIIVLNFIYASNYEIVDIESYYLPMITMLSIFLGAGAIILIQFYLDAFNKRSAAVFIVPAALIILPVSGLIGNYFVCDRSSRTFARQGVIDMIDSMEPGGLALVENWDFYSPWLYLHFEDNMRQDIVLLDKELMRRSWYIDFIRRVHPEIYQHSAEAIEDFLEKVEPFERSLPFNPAVLDAAYYNMLHAIAFNESSNRPVYTNILLDKKFTANLPLVPAGILYKVSNIREFMEIPRFEFNKQFWDNRTVYRGKRIAAVLSYYKTAFSSREKYCGFYGKEDEAEYYMKMTADVAAVINEIDSRN